jgi:hypothetical protein
VYRTLVRTIVAVCLVGGPLSELIWALVWPGSEALPAAANVAAVRAAPGPAALGVWLDLGVLLLIPAALLAGRAVGAGSSRLARIGTGLLFAGSLAFTYMLPADSLLIAAARTGGATTAQAFLESPVVSVATLLGLVLTLVGSVVLGIAALRIRRIPAWAGACLIAWNVVQIAGTVLDLVPLAALGDVLLLAAFAACAVRLVRPVHEVETRVAVAEPAL